MTCCGSIDVSVSEVGDVRNPITRVAVDTILAVAVYDPSAVVTVSVALPGFSGVIVASVPFC